MSWWTCQRLRFSSLGKRLAVVAKLAVDGADSAEPLLFALKDRAPEVRAAAARALGRIRHKPAVDPIVALLADKSPAVRLAAMEALLELMDRRAVTPLIGVLRDPDIDVRAAAARTLQKFGWRPADDSERVLQVLATGKLQEAAEIGSEAVMPLAEIMRKGLPQKQIEAVKVLGHIDDPRVPMLMMEALKVPSIPVCIAALSALQTMATAEAYDEIVPFLSHNEPAIRSAAVEAAVCCGGERVIPELLKMLRDASWDVRRAVVKSLGTFRHPSIFPQLAELLKDKDRDVRETTVTTLARLQDLRAVPALVLALIDPESLVRTAAAQALRLLEPNWMRDESVAAVIPKIEAVLDHEEYWVRYSAQKLLEQLNTARSAAPTEKVPAQQPKPEKVAGKKIPHHPAFDVLVELLGDHDRDVRLAAVEALGQLRVPDSLEFLFAAAQDEDALVRGAAQDALAALN